MSTGPVPFEDHILDQSYLPRELFCKHHNMRERMLDANPYKLCISHIQEKSATTYAVSICFCCHQMWRFAYSSKTIRTGQSRADCTDFTIMRGENKHFWVSRSLSAFVSAVILGHPTVFTPTALDSNASFAIPRLWRQPGSWHCGGPSTWSPKINCSKTIWWTAHQPNSWDLISWNHHSFFVFCLVGFPTLGTDRVT